MHFLSEMYLGLGEWLNIPIKTWIEVKGLLGTVRVRLQLVGKPPFFKNATITLMGTPAVNVSAVPLSKVLPNVLDLPFISGFARSAMEAVFAEYTAPKVFSPSSRYSFKGVIVTDPSLQSLTMDLAQLTMGDDIKKGRKRLLEAWTFLRGADILASTAILRYEWHWSPSRHHTPCGESEVRGRDRRLRSIHRAGIQQMGKTALLDPSHRP